MNGGQPTEESIGERLRRLRLERGLSQRELAGPGVSYAYISRIEAGARRPSVKALRTLARTLGVSAEYLETGSEIREVDERELRLADAELELRLAEDSAKAEETLARVLDDALGDGDFRSATRARVGLGLAAFSDARYGDAVACLEEASASESLTPAARPDVYATLGRAYAALGAPERAVELFEGCLAEVTEKVPDDAAVQIRFAGYLSAALAETGDLARAQSVLAGALERADYADPYSRVRLYWSLARLAEFEGRPAAALDYARRAIALLETTEDTRHLAQAHLLCGRIIMILQGNAEAAEPHLALAERLFGPRADRSDLASLRAEQAKQAAQSGQSERAIALAQEALELIGDEDPGERGGALWALADALALKGDVEEADAAFRQAAELLATHGHGRDAVEAHRSWGKLLRRAGREAEALDVLERAADLAVESEPAQPRLDR